MGALLLAVLVLAFRMGSQLGGNRLLDGASFLGLVGGANEVDGHFGFNGKVGDALPARWYQRWPLVEARINHFQ